jgi:hypothetical protein
MVRRPVSIAYSLAALIAAAEAIPGCGRTPLASAPNDSGTRPAGTNALAITGDLPELARVDEAYTGSLAAVGASGSCQWSVVGALPTGLAVLPDGTAAVVDGKPEQSGKYEFEIRVQDSEAREARRNFRIEVRPRPWLAYAIGSADEAAEIRVADADRPGTTFTVTGARGGTGDDWSWSPEGDYFAYVSGRLSAGQLHLVDLRSASPQAPTSVGAPLAITQTNVLPGGQGLLYESENQMFFARFVNGSAATPLEILEAPAGTYFRGDSLSPTGAWLMVRGLFESLAVDILAIDLGLDTPAGTVAIHPPLVAGGNVSAWAWSPDGRWLMYEADAEQDDTFELYAVPVETHGFGPPVKLSMTLPPGGEVGKAVPGEEFDWSWPQWSPDSKKAAFAASAEQDGTFALYVVEVGPSPRPIKVSQSFAQGWQLGDFTWADEHRLLYWSELKATGADDLLLVDTATNPAHVRSLVASADRRIPRVVVDPKGRGLLYASADLQEIAIEWRWQAWETGPAEASKVYGPVAWSWGLYEPAFSPAGTGLLFTTEGDDWGTRTGAGLFWAGMRDSSVLDPIRLQGSESGGVPCEMYQGVCQPFWRSDGSQLAYLTSLGELYVLDAGDGQEPTVQQVITAPDGGVVADFRWAGQFPIGHR